MPSGWRNDCGNQVNGFDNLLDAVSDISAHLFNNVLTANEVRADTLPFIHMIGACSTKGAWGQL